MGVGHGSLVMSVLGVRRRAPRRRSFAVHLGLVTSLIVFCDAEDQPAIDELVQVLAPSELTVFQRALTDFSLPFCHNYEYIVEGSLVHVILDKSGPSTEQHWKDVGFLQLQSTALGMSQM